MANLLQFTARSRHTTPVAPPSPAQERQGPPRHSHIEALRRLAEIESVLADHTFDLDPDDAIECIIDSYGPNYTLNMLINEIVESNPDEWSQSPSSWRALVTVFWLKYLGIEV